MFFLQAIINCVNLTTSQKPAPDQQSFRCGNNGNLKSDDLLQQRDIAFNHLAQIGGVGDGYQTGEGAGIWTSGLCPPNIKKEACNECIINTIPYLKKNCPKQKEGVAYTVLPRVICIVRYTDSPNIQRVAELSWATFGSPPNLTAANAGELEKGLNNLADKLKGPAARGDGKYASGNLTYGPGSRTLYGSMQCSPPANVDTCMNCFSDATKEIHNCCSKNRKMTGLALSGNCYLWYAHFKFHP
ncbi:hypothetical protein L1987_69737 [Smallanthus sonchifolius]|uniref:Uncharacterized protein n=1 Tax=Smallanthus sonchifolius TaxID=185202 RepID=A0ACB9B6Y5_9ASTR|nr:hypothetical protein L1987_69737 [Smallanthus sonchifolius]